MENIKEKLNKPLKLYFKYMLIALSGASIYCLTTLLVNHFEIAIIGLITSVIIIFSYYIYKNSKSNKINKINRFFWLRVTESLFTQKTQDELFIPIMADWQEEYFEALIKKDIWKMRWINVRYTYAFLTSMWMKSPIGDLIEFIRKFAK